MKRVRNQRSPWHVPPTPPDVATFRCRTCGAALTGPLRRLDDLAALSGQELAPLVPAGTYWLVVADDLPTSHHGIPVDFTGCYAVRPEDLVGVGNHPDRGRWLGCCGPSGTGGPNRVCGCGLPVGTERSDCMWPVAVYLESQVVLPGVTDAEPLDTPGMNEDPDRRS